MRTAARKDANHNDIVKAFRAMGWAVHEVYQLKNCCDLYVSRCGITIAVEIKNGKKSPSKRKLTEGEKSFMEEWKGLKAVVKSIGDVQWLHAQYFRASIH